jgi:hypothetical protein
VDGAMDIRDFRPVSLVHGAVFFFFDQVLSNRLPDDLQPCGDSPEYIHKWQVAPWQFHACTVHGKAFARSQGPNRDGKTGYYKSFRFGSVTVLAGGNAEDGFWLSMDIVDFGIACYLFHTSTCEWIAWGSSI